jgi:hypothetical protein
MNTTPRRILVPALALATTTLQAHPGHDGHELTWDLDHLAAHPAATLLCFAVMALGAWLLGQAFGAVRRKFFRAQK